MKKLSILLLLTIVLASFSFAQVSVTGGFEVDNLTEGNKKKVDPSLWTEFYGAASEELGPGTIGVGLGLGTRLYLSDKHTPYKDAGDIYLKGSYALPAGPGKLNIGLSTWADFNSLHFDLGYDGIAVGPATIGAGITYAFNTSGEDGKTDAGATDYAIFGDDAEKLDVFTAKLSAAFDFGLGIVYKFQYYIGDEETTETGSIIESGVKKIVYLDVSYALDPLTVGIEIDDTGDDFKGFTVKPYADYSITEKTSAGFSFKIANIGNDTKGADDLVLTPALTIKHVF
jgi:hypothetical protein